MGNPDDALLAAFASGDSAAAAAFVRQFQRGVYGLALTIVGDPAVAEDVAQEAFVRAWRHASSYDPRRGRVLTWLLAITRNVAIDSHRRKRPLPVDPDVLAAQIQGQIQPSDDSQQVDERDRLRLALASLAPEQRRSILLVVCFGRTALEISELDGVPLGTVKTRIRLALLRLRSELEILDNA